MPLPASQAQPLALAAATQSLPVEVSAPLQRAGVPLSDVALLVAPADVEQHELRQRLHSWTPMARQPLPFRAQVLASADDPHCSLERAQAMAADWGAGFHNLGALGHINAESGLGDWPEGHAHLLRLMQA